MPWSGVLALSQKSGQPPNGELYLPAHVAADAAGSLRSPAALLWCAAGKLQSRYADPERLPVTYSVCTFLGALRLG